MTESSLCFDRRLVHSQTLIDLVRQTKFIGVSGSVEFSSNSTDRINGSYYSLQNVQSLSDDLNFVPALDYSDDIGWIRARGSNLIIWPGKSLSITSDRPKLKNVDLVIGIIEVPPFTIKKTVTNSNGQNTTEYIGFIPDLTTLLKQQLGFNPDIRLAPSNQTYTQLIQTVPDDIYDIFIADVTITAARRLSVDFSNPFFDNSLRLIIQESTESGIDLLSFLRPFSKELWLLVLGACIYIGILICLAERHDNEALKDRSIVSQLAMSIWYAFGNLVGYGVDFTVNTAIGRVMTAGLYILSLILVASYTANLASNLTILKLHDVVSSLDDLKNGKVSPIRIGVRSRTAIEDFYLREVSDGLQNYTPLKTKQAAYDYLLDGTIDVALVDGGVAEYMINTIYCNLTTVGENYDKNNFGTVMEKNWIYGQELDIAILSLRESGELTNLRQKWFQTTSCPASVDTSRALDIKAMSGLFVTVAVIMTLSLCLILWSKRKLLKHRFFLQIGRTIVSYQRKFVRKTPNISSKEPTVLSIITRL